MPLAAVAPLVARSDTRERCGSACPCDVPVVAPSSGGCCGTRGAGNRRTIAWSHDDEFSSRDRSLTAEHTAEGGEPDVEPRVRLITDRRRSLRPNAEAVLIFSISSSDSSSPTATARSGGRPLTAELFAPISRGSRLGGYLLGRRLYETMLVCERDVAARHRLGATSPTSGARSRRSSSAARSTASGPPGSPGVAGRGGRRGARCDRQGHRDQRRRLAAQAIELGLVDQLRVFRSPVVVGRGTPFLPPVADDVSLDLIDTSTFGSRVIYNATARPRSLGLTPPTARSPDPPACAASGSPCCASVMMRALPLRRDRGSNSDHVYRCKPP